jgi:hypothetical protein
MTDSLLTSYLGVSQPVGRIPLVVLDNWLGEMRDIENNNSH